jgi:threonine/homoserine/homoserine lactone efflux protein
LLYLAWQAFSAGGSALTTADQPALTLRQLYVRGIVMNVTNPKVSIFFLAFLSQFVSPARGSVVVQIFILGALFALATVLVFGSVAVFAGSVGAVLRRSGKAQRIMNRVAGAVFAGLAIKLLVTQR